MKHVTVLVLLIALVGAGCGSLVNHAQYHVLPPGKQSRVTTVPAGEREAVKQILQTMAAEFQLEDRTQSSLIPNVIGAYSERDELYPITLAAWVHEGALVVDLLHQPYSVGETLKYRRMRERVVELLQERFGNRAILPARTDRITRVPARVK